MERKEKNEGEGKKGEKGRRIEWSVILWKKKRKCKKRQKC